MSRSNRYSPEVKQRAVRLVFDREHAPPSQWTATRSVAPPRRAGKIGCTAETLRTWARRAERDDGRRASPATDERAHIRELDHENRELRLAKEVLRKASAYFAQPEP
jgi:transposase